MNQQDLHTLTDAWHSDTGWLNDKIDEFFKAAQDHAYALGFARGLQEAKTQPPTSDTSLHPAPGVPDDVVRDAERYRWLRRKACVIGKTTYCGEETGQPILDFVNLPDVTEVIRRDSASTLDAAIDAAMLAASPAQKGGE